MVIYSYSGHSDYEILRLSLGKGLMHQAAASTRLMKVAVTADEGGREAICSTITFWEMQVENFVCFLRVPLKVTFPSGATDKQP